jgi:hypothetical protein
MICYAWRRYASPSAARQRERYAGEFRAEQ